jgi:hypothetical protein
LGQCGHTEKHYDKNQRAYRQAPDPLSASGGGLPEWIETNRDHQFAMCEM